jgi:broad specificity phosphatase PhoE
MIKTYYLVRHMKKLETKGNPSLSSVGQDQAMKVADYLSQFPIEKIYSSPILRARETADVITDKLGIKYEINDLLKERVNWGDDPKQSFTDFLETWNESSKNRKWKPSVGDSAYEAGKRLEKMINNLSHTKDKHIVIVSHGGIITDFLINIFSEKYLDNIVKDFSTKREAILDQGTITIIKHDTNNNKYELIKLASVEHFT